MDEEQKIKKNISLVTVIAAVTGGVLLLMIAIIILATIISNSGKPEEQDQQEQSSEVTDENINSEIKADGSWNGSVNTPKIKNTGLTAVYWSGKEWKKLNSFSSQDEWKKWYDYSNQDWANAQSIDGSMWVWIPRFEYKIDSENQKINVKFTKVGTSTSAGYTLHPAFGTDVNNGGWKTDLSGFWVAKYPAGFQNGTIGEEKKNPENSNLKYTDLNQYTSNYLNANLTTDTYLTYPVFKANTYAYNIISVGDAYSLSKEIAKAPRYGLFNVDSHLQKNSEWGAVAYLTQSQYGVNGKKGNMNEVAMNKKNVQNTIYVNDDKTTNTLANVYTITSYGSNDTPNDALASSTKNMTGVFDLNGGIWERVAAFNKGGQAINDKWHNAMADSKTTESSEYVTLYIDNNKKGDATNETAGWNGDYNTYFSSLSYPVMDRGGCSSNTGDISGIFAYYVSYGYPSNIYGFRVCLSY